jgi:HK97 family phage major capsid protein
MNKRYTRFAVSMLAASVTLALAAPRAIGVGLMHYADNIGVAGQFGDGPPSDLKALHEATEKAMKALKEGIDRAQQTASDALEKVRQEGTITGEQNTKLTELGTKNAELSELVKTGLAEIKQRTLDLEQKVAHKPGGEGEPQKSIGQMFANSEQLKAMLQMKTYNSAPVSVPSLRKATIVNASGQNQPLVPVDRIPGITFAPEQRLTIRDLIPVLRTSSNSIEWIKELVFTNNAGPQGSAQSPGTVEDGNPKPESGITFELNTTAVITLAHWIPASRQVLSDAPYLQDYIDMRLRYGLKLEEEDEILNGNGTAGQLNGLVNQATAFTGGGTNQTRIDTLLRAMTQVRLSFYEPNGVVLHPSDWQEVLLAKDTTGRYLFADPHNMEEPRIWGKPVVETPSQSIGQFLVGAFDRAAQIVDREDASVRVSDQHADFFTRNLIAILCEERLAVLVTRPAALVKGAMTTAG